MSPTDPSRTADEPPAATDRNTVTGASPPQPDPYAGTASAAAPAGDPTRTGGAVEPPSLPPLDPPRDPKNLGRLDQYEILGVLGRGGMGVVLKAHDEALDRVVAIKVLAAQYADSPAARKRFTREARAAAAVTHDNVVAVHAVVDRSPYLVMQYVAGQSLQQWLDERGPGDVETVVRIGAEIAAGLAAAHARGLVHRDIKPSNVLLEPGTDRVKITDFGLARAVDDESVTQSGTVLGTPLYMSPEQARGDPVDPRSDLFSLGSVLYALCAGRPPFRASGTMAVLRRVIDDDPPPLAGVNPAVPDWLAGIVHRLLAKDPADRFQSAAAVARLLSDYLAHLRHPDRHGQPPAPADVAFPPPPPDDSTAVTGPTWTPRLEDPKRPARRNPWMWLTACGLLTVLIGLASLCFWIGPPPDGPPKPDVPTGGPADPTPPAVPGTGAASKTLTPDPGPGGAAKDPARFDDEYVYRAMLADLKGLAEEEVKNARYLSLHHVAAAAPAELAEARKEFEAGLKSVLKPGAPIHQVDPAGTVYRIDLERSGWHYRPFVKADDKGRPAGAVEFNLYDLVLLEYPHAAVPNDSGPFDQLAKKFLASAGQVLPIAFVRGDWFVATVTASHLTRDLYLCMKKYQQVPTGLVPRGMSKPPTIRKVGPPTRGMLLPALDAWYAREDPPDPKVVKNVVAATVDAKRKDPRAVFHEDDQFVFRAAVPRIFEGGKTTYFQFAHVDSRGLVETWSPVAAFPAGGIIESQAQPEGGFAAEFGIESVRTYFAHYDFGPGTHWRAKIESGEVERLVHVFFPLREVNGRIVVDTAAAEITRKTLPIEIAPRK